MKAIYRLNRVNLDLFTYWSVANLVTLTAAHFCVDYMVFDPAQTDQQQ